MTSYFRFKHWALLCLVGASLQACGGGSSPAAAPAISAPAAATGTAPPALAANLTPLAQGSAFGTPQWPDGSSAAGGQGQTIAGVECLKSEAYHIHAHLSIFRNGEQLAIPAHIGLVGCAYELHTHDSSGIVHVETSTSRAFTLGQFFAVWGQPLSTSNVAGITGLPVAFYTVDGASLAQYTGNPADIALQARRDIVIVIGTAPATIPNYQWDAGL
jgi:hypothetical protein